MTDIVERLRDYKERFIFQGGSEYAHRIADEIERLRNELQEVAGLMERRAKRIRAMVPNAEIRDGRRMEK